MKRKYSLLVLVLAVACLLSACHVTTNFSDSTGNTAMESIPQVEQMLEALAFGDINTALTLMHEEKTAASESGLAQMSDYLAGRKVTEMKQLGVNVNTSNGTSGTTRQEQGTFQITLEDGTEFVIVAVHLSNGTEKGFISFQLVLGAI